MKQLLIINITVISLLFSCKKNTNKDVYESNDSFENKIEATATIKYPDDIIIQVSPAMEGILKKIMVPNKDSVEKGEPIAILQNPDYLDIQKEYLSKKYELEYLREDFKRQGELTVENVTSIKKMQKAKSDFYAKEAVCMSLEKKLQLIGINPKFIFKNGPTINAILISPAKGRILYENIKIGELLLPGVPHFHIIEKDSLIAELKFFNNEYISITKGMIFTLIDKNHEDIDVKITDYYIKPEKDYFIAKAEIIGKPSDIFAGLIFKIQKK